MSGLLVVSPVYADFTPESVLSLLDVFRVVRARGWKIAPPDFLYQQGSLVVHARNELAAQVLDRTEAEWIVWTDADMRFEGETVARMIEAGEDVVGVASPSRSENRLIFFGPHRPVDARGLVEVDGLGFGLVAMRRKVLQQFRDARLPMFREEPGPTPADHDGEDVCFCRDYVGKLGGKLYILADAPIGHVGRVMFAGNYMDQRGRRPEAR